MMFASLTARSTGLTLALCALCWPALAVPQTGDKPIEIEADRAELSQRSGVSTYRGDVVLTQGKLVMKGNKLVVERDLETDTIHATLTGQPATLHKASGGDTRLSVDGHADRMQYDSGQQRLLLEGDAVITRGGDAIRGESIEHDLATSNTRAQKADDGERVRITIQPDSLERENGDEPSPELDE